MRSLTVKQVAAITAPGAWRVSRNLYVQVSGTGTKSWLFRYMFNGTSHGMGLGSLELVTLAEARDKALLCRKMLLDGLDPLAERRAKRTQALLTAATAITFATAPSATSARTAWAGRTASTASSGPIPSRPMPTRWSAIYQSRRSIPA